jgi:hypothetical protein
MTQVTKFQWTGHDGQNRKRNSTISLLSGPTQLQHFCTNPIQIPKIPHSTPRIHEPNTRHKHRVTRRVLDALRVSPPKRVILDFPVFPLFPLFPLFQFQKRFKLSLVMIGATPSPLPESRSTGCLGWWALAFGLGLGGRFRCWSVGNGPAVPSLVG